MEAILTFKAPCTNANKTKSGSTLNFATKIEQTQQGRIAKEAVTIKVEDGGKATNSVNAEQEDYLITVTDSDPGLKDVIAQVKGQCYSATKNQNGTSLQFASGVSHAPGQAVALAKNLAQIKVLDKAAGDKFEVLGKEYFVTLSRA